jgi:coenzyme F420-reducing hydrogenase delta subunit
VGINPDRLLLAWVSGSEANRFAQVVQEFTEWVRKIGPLESKSQHAGSGKRQEARP